MPVTYENRVNRSSLLKSNVPVDGEDGVILSIPYSLVAIDGDTKLDIMKESLATQVAAAKSPALVPFDPVK